MKDPKPKVGEKVSPRKNKTLESITKPTKKLWKHYFGKKKKQTDIHEEINEDNWWEFI